MFSDPLTGLSYALPDGFTQQDGPDGTTLVVAPPDAGPGEGFGHHRSPAPPDEEPYLLLGGMDEQFRQQPGTRVTLGKPLRLLDSPGHVIHATVEGEFGPLDVRLLALVQGGWLHLFTLARTPGHEKDLQTAFDTFLASLAYGPPTAELPGQRLTVDVPDGRPTLTLPPILNPKSHPAGTIGQEVQRELTSRLNQTGRYRLAPQGTWELTVVIEALFEMEGFTGDPNAPPDLEAVARLNAQLHHDGKKVWEDTFSAVDRGLEGDVRPYLGRGLFADEDQREQGYSRALARTLTDLVNALAGAIPLTGTVLALDGNTALVDLGTLAGLTPGTPVTFLNGDTVTGRGNVAESDPFQAVVRITEGDVQEGFTVRLSP